MPQVSERPPPYSREWSSFPPPLQADVDHRVWIFQRAFENAREIVRWSILQTFKAWQDDWALKDQRISRNVLQQAYIQAPNDLKQAVDWQLEWDTPVVMHCDEIRRWHEHVRRKEAGLHEDILPLRKFEEEFDAASPAVQKAVQRTVSVWTDCNEPVRLASPPRELLAGVYENASPSLKLAMCFVLEMGIPVPIQQMNSIDERRADIYMMVAEHRAQVIPYWDDHGKAAGLW